MIRLRRIAVLGIATLGAVAANLWIAAHRLEGYSFEPAAYATVYVPAEEPVVARVERPRNDEVILHLSGGSNAWLVKGREKTASTQQGPLLRLKTPPGVAAYELSPAGGGGTTAFGIDTFADPAGEVALASPDLLFVEAARHPLSSLVPALAAYDPRHVEAARAHLAKRRLDAPGSTEERFRRLWESLRDELRPRIGAPPPALVREAPWLQYQRAVAGEVELYCANLSEILVFFATVAGIPARVVDVAGKKDAALLGAHTFVEVYLAEERRWMYTDLTIDAYRIRAGAHGPALNGGELLHLIHARADGLLFITRLRNGKLEETAFADAVPSPRSFIHPNALLVFHRDYGERRHALPVAALRYLFQPEPAYGLAFDPGRGAIKRAAFIALVLLALTWAGLAAGWLRRRAVSA